MLSSFVTLGVGFVVRPFGALFFGRIGDLVGRKYTFLITITVMGLSTALVGVLPTFATIGWVAPIILVLLRATQGLALGGEYGGAATYVAEHSPQGKRGLFTSWIQTTATLGLFLSLAVIWTCRILLSADAFKSWGWRIPFLLSVVLLGISIYIRLKLQESPLFLEMKAQGKGSTAPLRDSFLTMPNAKYVWLALCSARQPVRASSGIPDSSMPCFSSRMRLSLKDFTTLYALVGRCAFDRHSVLYLFRLAFGSDRAQGHYHGRMSVGGAHLFSAFSSADHLCEPGARRGYEERADRGLRPRWSRPGKGQDRISTRADILSPLSLRKEVPPSRSYRSANNCRVMTPKRLELL